MAFPSPNSQAGTLLLQPIITTEVCPLHYGHEAASFQSARIIGPTGGLIYLQSFVSMITYIPY